MNLSYINYYKLLFEVVKKKNWTRKDRFFINSKGNSYMNSTEKKTKGKEKSAKVKKQEVRKPLPS